MALAPRDRRPHLGRPFPERLALIAERARGWQLANVCIAAASVPLVLGFVLAPPSAWGGWLCLAFGALLLVQLATTGDALPVTYHLGPLALGGPF